MFGFNKEENFDELLEEIEAIVYSGTKLNIDYFLNEIMDEDHMLDIYDYFKGSTTDKISDAMDELGNDFTEEEFFQQSTIHDFRSVTYEHVELIKDMIEPVTSYEKYLDGQAEGNE